MDSDQRATGDVFEPSREHDVEDLCKFCGQAEIDRYESAKSQLCHSCREKMIRHPIPKVFILFSVIIAILIGTALYRFPKVLECYRIYQNSSEQARNGEITVVLTDLKTVIEKYPDSTPISIRAVDISMNGGYYDFAGYVIDTYLSGKKIDQHTVDRLNKYVDRLDRYYTTIDAMGKMESELGTDLSQEEMIKARHDFIKELLNDTEQDKALLYYYLYAYAEDPDEMKSSLENCVKEDNTFLAAEVELSKLLRRQGDIENAEKYCEEVLGKDKYNSEALRCLAIIRLLNGDKKEGLDLAYKAYAQDPDGLYTWDTYIVALHENDKSDETDAQIKDYLSKGNTLDEDTKDYLDDKISLNDLYIDE